MDLWSLNNRTYFIKRSEIYAVRNRFGAFDVFIRIVPKRMDVGKVFSA